MSLNIVDLVKQQIGSNLIGQISQSLSEDSTAMSNAVSGAIPSVLGGVISSLNHSDGRQALGDYVDRQDPQLLDNLSNIIGGEQQSKLINAGSSMLNSILGGGALSGLIGALSRFSGIESGSAGSMIGMIAPIVMTVIRRQRDSANLDTDGLAQMLAGQQQNVSAAMPDGFQSQLKNIGVLDRLSGNLLEGVQNRVRATADAAQDSAAGGVAAVSQTVNQGVSSATDTAAAGVRHAKTEGSSFINRILPVAALVAVVFIGWKFFLSGDPEQAATSVGNSATAAVAANMSEADIGDQLSTIFAGANNTLDGIKDVESAKAALPDLEGYSETVNSMTSVFTSLPDAVRGQAKSIIGDNLPGLQDLVEKVLALPGVGDVLQPVLGPMVENLSSLNA